MKKIAIKNKNLIIMFFLIVFTITTLTYAFFKDEENFYLNYLGSGNIGLSFTGPETLTQEIFNIPGDTYSTDLTVENTGNCCFTYSFNFNLIVPHAFSGLEKAVFLHLDGVFYGSLYDALQNGTQTIEEGYTEYDFELEQTPLYIGETKIHYLVLEYHIGAGSYYNDKYFDLNIECNATQLTEKNTNYIYAKNYQLSKIVSAINYKDKTIKLLGNTILNQDITFSEGVNIDLNGFSLDLNQKTLSYNYAYSGVYNITDTKGGGSVNNGNININTALGLIKNIGTVWNNVNFTVTNSDFQNIFINSIIEKTKSGIVASLDYLSSYSEYATSYDLTTLSSQTGVLSFDGSVLSVITPVENTKAELTFGFLTGDVRSYVPVIVTVLGAEDSIISLIESVNHISFTSGTYEERHIIKRDLFLPIKDAYYGATIFWDCSHPDILTKEGKFIKPYFDTDFALSATYSFNGKNIIKTFYLFAEGRTIQEKIEEVRDILGNLYFLEANTSQSLPLAATYENLMGFTAFEYSVKPNETEMLTEIISGEITTGIMLEERGSYPPNTEIYLKGFIDEEFAETSINIYIDIISEIDIIEAAHRNVQMQLGMQLGEQRHTFNNIVLPSLYLNNQTKITYDVKVSNIILDYQNTADVESYIKIFNGNPDVQPVVQAQIEIIKDQVPVKNTLVYIEVTVENGDRIDTRLISFNVTGILHYGEDIGDITLFHLLRRICDANNDWYITNDEALTVTIIPAFWYGSTKTVYFTNNNIYSVKGLEYFENLTEIDLSTNFISDLTPISTLFNLTKLILNNNKITDVTPLSMLLNLVELNLGVNDIRDIGALENLELLEILILTSNINIFSFEVIENFDNLKSLNVYDTYGILVADNEMLNLNYLITAYNNALPNYGNNKDNLSYYTTSSTVKWEPQEYDTYANNILATIVPIYEFSNVIYLPFNVYYKDNPIPYSIEWTTTSDIINIDTVTNRAYITQPVSSVDVILKARINYGSKQYYRAFKVLSKEKTVEELEIEITPGVFGGAYELIKDSTLRYHLFKHFDTDLQDNKITLDEIAAKSNVPLNLIGLNIKSIEGLNLFNGIENINLQNTNLESIKWLNSITSLKYLYLSAGSYDFSELSALDKLVTFSIYGCENLNTTITLKDLYNIYVKNPNIEIFKDSLDTEWNPYIESLTKALTSIKNIYVLNFGETLSLDTNFELHMYNGDTIKSIDLDINKYVSYSVPTGQSFTLSNNTISISYASSKYKLSAYDKYEILNASILYKDTTVTAKFTVIIVAPTDWYVEWHEGEPEILAKVVPNYTLREQILAVYDGTSLYNNKPIITRVRLELIPTANLYCINDNYGLKNLEVFKGVQNFKTLNIQYFSPQIYESNGIPFTSDLKLLTSIYKLNAINFTYSRVNIYDLVNIKSQLVSLSINQCNFVDLYNGTAPSPFNGFSELTSLKMTNSNINNFEAIRVLANEELEIDCIITTLYLYGNTASNTYETDSIVNAMYNKLPQESIYDYDYRVTASSSKWVPVDKTYIANTITDFNVIINPLTENKKAEYGFYNPNYKIKNNDTILLPLEIEINEDISYDIAWSSSANKTINATTGIVTAQDVKAYVIVTGSIEELNNKTIQYVFVVDEIDPENIDTYQLNLTTFMPENCDFFEDPVFVYRALTMATVIDDETEANRDGVYVLDMIEQIPSMLLNSSNLATDIYTITSIKGISNFIGLTQLHLHFNAISDISELYDLELLEELFLHENTIKSLYVTDSSHANYEDSVFAQMSNLTTLYIHNNYLIKDYRPIVLNRPDADIKKLSNLYIYNIANDVFDFNDYYKYQTVIDWWDLRNSVNGVTSNLQLFSSTNIRNTKDSSGAITLNNINIALNILKALNEEDKTILITAFGQSLTPEITVDGITYSLQWDTLGAIANIMTISNGTVSAITSENLKTNHLIPMKMSVNTLGVTIGVVVNIDLQILAEQTLKIELTETEYTDSNLYPNLKYEENNAYYVNAEIAIPDSMLRNRLFHLFDASGDYKISTTERLIVLSNFDASDRGIFDIRGLELFPNIITWTLNTNKITRIPKLAIQKNSTLTTVNLSGNNYLWDFSDINYLHNNDSVNYISFANKVTSLNITNCYGVTNEQIQFIKNMALTTINVSGLNISDFSFLLDNTISNSLTAFTTGSNFYVNTNDNPENLRKFYLRRKSTAGVSGISTVIFGDYIKIDDDYELVYSSVNDKVNGEYVLPSIITMYGVDYTLKWTTVDDLLSHRIRKDQSDNKYYIKIYATDGRTITNRVRAVYYDENTDTYYDTYRETITLKTAFIDSVNSTYKSEASFIDKDGIVTNLAVVMPDMVLRYYVISAINPASNLITAQEIENITILNINSNTSITSATARQTITSLEGLDILFNSVLIEGIPGYFLTELNISLAATSDFSALAELKGLKTLTIRYNLLPISDFKFVHGLDNLETFSLLNTKYTNMSFVMDKAGLTRLSYINAANTQDTAMYVKNAFGYARLANSLEENATAMGGALLTSTYTSALDEKAAALILDINISKQNLDNSKITYYMNGKGFIYLPANNGELGYVLPEEYDYFGKPVTVPEAKIQWQSLSDILTIDGNVLKYKDGIKKVAGLVASIEYNNARYYRYFEVHIE